jgi:hypothetical protein
MEERIENQIKECTKRIYKRDPFEILENTKFVGMNNVGQIYAFFSTYINIDKDFERILVQLSKRKNFVVENYSVFFVYIFCLANFPDGNDEKLIRLIDEIGKLEEKKQKIYNVFENLIWNTEDTSLRSFLVDLNQKKQLGLKHSFGSSCTHASKKDVKNYFLPNREEIIEIQKELNKIKNLRPDRIYRISF